MRLCKTGSLFIMQLMARLATAVHGGHCYDSESLAASLQGDDT